MAEYRRLPSLDGLRGLAVLMVFILHYGGGAESSSFLIRITGELIRIGWTGVTLFFILSGFLITGILWDSRMSSKWWSNFYIRRVLRIFPLYYGALLLVLATAIIAGKGLFSLSRIWIFGFYLQNVPPLITKAQDVGSPLLLSHFWSLAVEEQFYLAWPFLLIRTKNLDQARRLCAAIFFFSAAFRVLIAFTSTPLAFSSFILSRAGELAAGAYLAMCFREPARWQRIKSCAPAVFVISMAIVAIIGFYSHDLDLTSTAMFVWGLPFAAAGFGALLVLALSGGVINRAFSISWLRWLGGISYGVYVYHVLFRPLFVWLPGILDPHASSNTRLALTFLIAASLSVIIAWLSFRYFESCFLRLKQRFTSPVAQQEA